MKERARRGGKGQRRDDETVEFFPPPLLFLFFFFFPFLFLLARVARRENENESHTTIEVHRVYVELLVRVSEAGGVLNMKIWRGIRVLSSSFLTGREISSEWKYTCGPTGEASFVGGDEKFSH